MNATHVKIFMYLTKLQQWVKYLIVVGWHPRQ